MSVMTLVHRSVGLRENMMVILSAKMLGCLLGMNLVDPWGYGLAHWMAEQWVHGLVEWLVLQWLGLLVKHAPGVSVE